MMLSVLRAAAIGGLVFVVSAAGAGTAPSAAQVAAPLSPADAAPFLGEWTLALQGPNGPGTFTLSITAGKDAEKDKVTAEIVADTIPKQPMTSLALNGKSLILNWSFVYDGNPVDAVVTLTPDKEGKTAAQIDFAGGAYVMGGTATKKDPAKQ